MKKQFQILATTFITIAIVSCSKERIEMQQAEPKSTEEISTSSSSSNERGIVIDPLTVNLEGSFQFNGDLKDQTRKLADGVSSKRTVLFTKDRKGNFNSAIKFDSTYGIKLKSIPQQTHTSLSVWIKPTSTSQVNSSVVSSYGFGPHIFHAMNSVGGAVSISPWGSIGDWAGTINAGWQHVVVTYDGLNIKIYLNNSLKVNISKSGSVSGLVDYFVAYRPQTEFWKGYVDDLRFYSRTLTATDVQKLYNL